MKCFVAIASLLGASTAEPFYGATQYAAPAYGTGYSVAPTLIQAARPAVSYAATPAAAVVPATMLRTKTYNAATYTTVPDMVAAAPSVAQVAAAPAIRYAAQPVMHNAPAARITVQPTGITSQQFHAQDEFGNYAYGYANPNSQKREEGNVNTAVRGSYSYNVAPGLNRRVEYVADGLGFRVTGNAISRAKRSLGYGMTPYAPAMAPATLLRTKTYNAATYTTIPDDIPAVQYSAPVPAMTHAAQPVAHVAAAPAVYANQAVAGAARMTGYTSKQYHAQDEFGNYAYGYANPTAQKHEEGNVKAAVTGSYNYNVAPGLNRRVDYVADASGFHIVGNVITPQHRMKRSLVRPFRSYAAVPSAAISPAVSPATLLRTKTYNAATYTTVPDMVAAAPVVQYSAAAPAMAYAAAPTAPAVTYAAAPAAPIMSYAQAAPVTGYASGVTATQYHTGDEFGNYAYGYANQNSAKQETGSPAGVQGHYSFVDAHGVPRRVDYAADAYGFRASKHF